MYYKVLLAYFLVVALMHVFFAILDAIFGFDTPMTGFVFGVSVIVTLDLFGLLDKTTKQQEKSYE